MPTRSFVAEPTAVRAARAFLRSEFPLTGERAQVAELLLSELVTNVVRHARTEFTVELQLDGRTLVAVVADGVAVDLALADLRHDADGGRGLRIVDALADSWGASPTPHGKQVWFRLALEP